MLNTPILITAFNRPDQTQQVFDAIRKAKPKYLYVCIDGPRLNKKGEAAKVQETKDIFKQIDWECQLKTLFQPQNIGCKNSVSGGIDWFFENEEVGIILEDDCVPSMDFLFSTEKLLIKYKNEDYVFMIGGHNMLSHITKNEPSSYIFTPFPFIWGWATWRRAWQQRDLDISDFGLFLKTGKINHLKINNASKKYLLNKFNGVKEGKIDSWAYGWFYTMLKNQAISIIYSKNSIVNIGFGEDSTHTKKWDYNMQFEAFDKPLKHPNQIKTSNQLDQAYFYKTQKKKSELIANLILPKSIIKMIKKVLKWA